MVVHGARYPRKCANSSTMANPKLVPVSPSSGSDQENGSPVSVLSTVQSDAFGSSVSNLPTGCTSPVSSDDWNNARVGVNGEEIVPPKQAEIHQSVKEIKQDNSDGDLSEEDSIRETSLKLFGKTVIIPDPKKVCSSDGGHGEGERCTQSSYNEMFEASSVSSGGCSRTHRNFKVLYRTVLLQCPPSTLALPMSVRGVATYAAPNGWLLPYHSFPFHMAESGNARIHPHVWWPYYGFPVSHPRELGAVLDGEGTGESDTAKSPSAESSSNSMGNVQMTTTPSNCEVAKESMGAVHTPDSALS